MPQVYGYALSGRARSGATRSGYTSGQLMVSVNGVEYGTVAAAAANRVLQKSLRISEVLNDTPNSATFTMRGAEPSEGKDVVMRLGSTNNGERLYAGTVINRSHQYFDKPANWLAKYDAVDYTWGLTRRQYSGSFTNASVATIAAAIVAKCPGYTVLVASGLPTIDAISFTDVDCLTAFTRLAKRFGGYCDVDYFKVVKLFITDTTVTNPTDLTVTHPSLSDFSFTRDLSQVRTRIFVEGGGVNALSACAVGESIIPLNTVAWYNPLGGKVKSGAQHLTYTGIFTGGGGTLIGPGISPSSPPTLAPAAGAGLTAGVYQYAYTDVTAAGETLPSPLGTITVTDVTGPSSAPSINNALNGNLATDYTIGDTLQYKVTYSAAADVTDLTQETVPSAASGAVVAQDSGHDPEPIYANPPQFTIAASSDSRVQWIRLWRDRGAGYFLIGSHANTAWVGYDTLTASAAGLGAGSNTYLQVALSGIAIGPSGTTQRKIYRTVVNGAQLKLQQTIANNTATVGVQDATADGSLGANAPTGDTSGFAQPAGQVNAGSSTLLLAGAGAFSTSGWVSIGNGRQFVRYTGVSGNTLTGIPASGTGAITATVTYNTTATAVPALTGIPTSGTGSILYPLVAGDQVNLLVQCDNAASQAALATLIGGGDDGIVEDYLQDGTIGETEAIARGTAQLVLTSAVLVSITYKCRDKNTRAGRTIHVNLGSPTNITGDFKIQQVTIDQFPDTLHPAMMPTFTVQASSNRFSLEDLLRIARKSN